MCTGGAAAHVDCACVATTPTHTRSGCAPLPACRVLQHTTAPATSYVLDSCLRYIIAGCFHTPCSHPHIPTAYKTPATLAAALHLTPKHRQVARSNGHACNSTTCTTTMRAPRSRRFHPVVPILCNRRQDLTPWTCHASSATMVHHISARPADPSRLARAPYRRCSVTRLPLRHPLPCAAPAEWCVLESPSP